MPAEEPLAEFAGLPVAEFGDDGRAGRPPASEAAWRIRSDSHAWDRVFRRFLSEVDTARVSALVIGYWGNLRSGGHPVDLLVDAADRFPGLRALFVGDITPGESEISWIAHGDLTPLFDAFPKLERLEVRGMPRRLDPVRGENLKLLRLESGGLPAQVVQAVAASDFPRLERLDLWLGEDEYGGDAAVADLAPILDGGRLPALRHLGLEDSEIQDEIAAAIASAPVVARLETLSLAMGTLTDAGAEALLSGQPLTHLKELDLHHHFLSDAMIDRVRATLPGVDVDLAEQEEPHDGWFYVAVAE